jgi:hypothetical protein
MGEEIRKEKALYELRKYFGKEKELEKFLTKKGSKKSLKS